MKISLKSTALGLAAFGALAIAAPAWAGCGDAPVKSPAMFEKGQTDSGRFIRVGNDNSQGQASIAGLWAVNFYIGQTQTKFDWGFAAWHSDGTEIMNSGTRAPSTENFCMGVWAQTGGNSYQLTHYALSYDPTKAAAADGGINGRVVIREWVNLNGRGTQFTGTYTVDVYAPSGLGSPTRIAQGRITGDRLTVN